VFLLARRLFFGWPAALVGSVLFAIHGTTPEAVTWVAGRFDLIATFFILTGILLFIAYCSTRAAAVYFGSLLFMVLGMLSKESAYVFPLLLMAVLAVLPGAPRRDVFHIWPFWLLAIVIFAIRWHTLGGVGGYVDESSGRPQVFSFSILQAAKAAALRIWSALYFPINWSVEPTLFVAIPLMLSVGILVWLVATVSVERGQVLFGAAFLVISSLPALHQLLISSDLQKSRLLYLPSVGFCLMIGAAVHALRPKRVQIPAALILLWFKFSCLRHNLAIWQDVAALADGVCARIVQELPPSTMRIVIRELPGSVNGVYFLRNGLSSCLDLKAGRNLGLDVDTWKPGGLIGSHTAVFSWNEVKQSLPTGGAEPNRRRWGSSRILPSPDRGVGGRIGFGTDTYR
jgi:protein O-mannosyl-transferase